MADSEILINLFNNNSNNHLNNNVIRLLKIIYNNLDTTDKNKLNDNLKIYGLKQSELDKFYKYLDNYNKQNEVNDYLSVYKIIIDMIRLKYSDKYISNKEVKEYEKIFFEGKNINSLNDYWNKTLYEINYKFIDQNIKDIYNPYSIYTKGKSIKDLKKNSKIFEDNENKLNEYLDKINRNDDKTTLSSGNKYVDMLLILAVVSTQIMLGSLLFVTLFKR